MRLGLIYSTILSVGAICFPAVSWSADEIKVAAHAFMDYESISIDDMSVVDGTDLRLFRVDVGGSAEGFTFKSSFDLHGDDIKIQDLFAEFGDDTKIRLGNFKVMNGLEQQSSLYSLVFLEQSSVSKIHGISRAMGVGVFHKSGPFNLSAGVFGPNVNDADEEDHWSASARVAWTSQPFGDDTTVHLGASTRYRHTDETDLFSYSHKAFAANAPKTIKTSAVAESDVFIGLEGLLIRDGFTLQSEYAKSFVSCPSMVCSDDPTTEAFYVDASYMWGGHRNYSGSLFKRDRVDSPFTGGGRGAFALSARYDVGDLNDAALAGGRQTNMVLGASWYMNSYVRFTANYVRSDFDDSPVYGDGDADSLLLRAQIELY